MNKIVIVFILFGTLQFTRAFFGLTRLSNSHQEPQILTTPPKLWKFFEVNSEKWIEQSLDNSNSQDTRRWKQRYFEDISLFAKDGPILIYLGGEWSISPSSIASGTLIHEIAEETNGALFYLEHRYYGKSQPTSNTTTENLRFLSIDQALADTANFINYIKFSSNDFKNSKVIVVGASYSATMAAWMRLKYPHLVTGAFASSGPVNAKIDFYEYKEIMTKSIQRVGGDDCKSIIENAFDEMEELVATSNTSRITNAFSLCEPLNIPIDVPHFFYEISDVVASIVQGSGSQGIEKACKDMKELRKTREDIESLAGWIINEPVLAQKGIPFTKKKTNEECLDFSYENSIKTFSNVEWGALANIQIRQWIYQICSEFAWFQSSTSDNQIFGTTYPVDYFIRICNDLFDNKFDKKTIEFNIKRTNIRYGGFNPDLTNVVFTNGDLDPWHPMSILKSPNELVHTILIPLTAHVKDLGAISERDSDEMKASKTKVKELVMKWSGVVNLE